jgi:hypothetical protein
VDAILQGVQSTMNIVERTKRSVGFAFTAIPLLGTVVPSVVHAACDWSMRLERSHRLALSLVVAIGVSLATVASTRDVARAAGSQESLRVGSFNTQLLSPVFPDIPGPDVEERAHRIADRILADGWYDIIALNEVFDEDARDILVVRLAPTYPHYVAYIGDDTAFTEDSGLMLFSKFPFAPLPRRAYVWAEIMGDDDVLAVNGVAGDWKNEVAFTEFVAEAGYDSMAAKGAAYVRLINPHTGRNYNVIFTHLQSDGDHWDVRVFQIEQIVSLMTATIPDTEQVDTLIMGDFNIDGNHGHHSDGSRPEWLENFGHRNFGELRASLGWDVLDTWTYVTSRGDLGPTAIDSRARYDYIFHNDRKRSTRALCVQHMRRDLFSLSDHSAVNADLNLPAPQCSPVEARVLDNEKEPVCLPSPRGVCSPVALDFRGPPWDDRVYNGVLTYPGSMQWFKFGTTGTYSIGVDIPAATAGVRVDYTRKLISLHPSSIMRVKTAWCQSPATSS